MGVFLLVFADHPCATMKEKIKKVPWLLVKLLSIGVCFSNSVVKPVIEECVNFGLASFAFFSLLLPLGCRDGSARTVGSMANTMSVTHLECRLLQNVGHMKMGDSLLLSWIF